MFVFIAPIGSSSRTRTLLFGTVFLFTEKTFRGRTHLLDKCTTTWTCIDDPSVVIKETYVRSIYHLKACPFCLPQIYDFVKCSRPAIVQNGQNRLRKLTSLPKTR